MKIPFFISILALFLPAFCYSNDFINQLVFPDNEPALKSENSIHLLDQRFKASDYQFNYNKFTFNQTLDWGEFEFSQQFKSNNISKDDFSFTHSQNKQDLNLKINYNYGQINLGTNSQSLLFHHTNKYSIELFKHTIPNQLFIQLGSYDITESFSTQHYQSDFNYVFNTDSGLKISCLSNISFTSCNQVQLLYNNKLQQVWLGYTDKQTSLSDNKIESDQFQVNYKLSSELNKTEISYQNDQTKYGINHSNGELSTYVDLLFLNPTVNALGLGRKILFNRLEYNKTNAFISQNWLINKHTVLSRIDYSYIELSDFIYRDYESILFLGIPILNESIAIDSGDLHLIRLQFKYSYDFDVYRFSLDAKQLLFWDNSSENQTTVKTEPESSEIALQVLESDKKRFHWWDGLNLTMLIQWEL